MNSGLARGAAARGFRVAFGDGRRVIWHRNAYEILRNNPNVVVPNALTPNRDVRWIFSYPGFRPYNGRMNPSGRWTFTPGIQKVGELFFDPGEVAQAELIAPKKLVIIEPNTKHQAPNKRWPHERYATVARVLAEKGYRVAQFATGGLALDGVYQIRTGGFRLAAAVLQRARLYVGPEGGLHHAAAAIGTPAVVIFGGYISPAVTGYGGHVNLFTGEGLGCGQVSPCDHCRDAMARITVDEVAEAAIRILEQADGNLIVPTDHAGGAGHGARGDRLGSVLKPARKAGGQTVRLSGVLE